VFFTRPLSLALLAMAVALVLLVALPAIKSRREQAFHDND
jgi:TctA family transporter